jgi:carbamoyl-phosphate synthase large subunit
MGISDRFPVAFAKSQLAAGTVLPTEGTIFISVADRAKQQMVGLAERLERLGFKLIATKGTAAQLRAIGVQVDEVKKLRQGHPNLLDYMLDGNLQLVMNTPSGKGARTDEGKIRAAAVSHGVPCLTTLQAAEAAVRAMEAMSTRDDAMTVQAVQDRFPEYGKVAAT